MTTALLGANGKLGSILAHFMQRAGLCWKTQARTAPADVIWSGDFEDPKADCLFARGATLINMIGYTGPDCTKLRQVNVEFVRSLLAKAQAAGVAHVVLASSAAVYGAGLGTAFTENDALHPVNAYGQSKSEMEDAAIEFASTNDGPAITIMRIANVGGADALYAAAKRSVAAKTPMALHRFDDGAAPLRSYIGPQDLFDAIRALAAPYFGPLRIVNVTHPQPLTLDLVLAAYREHLLPNLEWVNEPVPTGVPQRVTLSTDKFRQLAGLTLYDDPANAMAKQMAKVLTA